MELIDEIYSSETEEEEEEEENGAEEIIFVCTSIASASTDELEEIQQKQQSMELVDEIHSSETEEEEIIFVCTTSSASAEGTDKMQQQKKQQRMSSETNKKVLKTEAGKEEEAKGQHDAMKGHRTEKRIYLPLTQKFLPPFPKLDDELSDDSISDEFDGTTETQHLAAELARHTLSSSDRAKAILRLLSDLNSEFSAPIAEDDQAEEKPGPFSTICPQSVCPTPYQPIGDDDDEIEYIGTTHKK